MSRASSPLPACGGGSVRGCFEMLRRWNPPHPDPALARGVDLSRKRGEVTQARATITQPYFRYAASIAAPSAPADFSHSAAMVAPILARPAFSSGVGSTDLDAGGLQRVGLDRHFLDRHLPAALFRRLGRVHHRLLLGRRQLVEGRLVHEHDVARQPGLRVDVVGQVVLRLGVDAGRGRGDHHVDAAGGEGGRQVGHLDLGRDRAGERGDAADHGIVGAELEALEVLDLG